MAGIFTATFSAVTVSAAQDLFEIVAPSTQRVRIREIVFGQYSDFGDAQAELLSVLLVRGNTTAGSGGSTVTPSNVSGTSGSPSASSSVARNNTTVASGGSPATLRAEVWNVAAPYTFIPAGEEQFILEASQRFCIRITAPADSMSVNGTLVFEEIAVG